MGQERGGEGASALRIIIKRVRGYSKLLLDTHTQIYIEKVK